MKRAQMQQIFRAVGRFSDVFLGHILPIQLLFYYQYFLYYDPYVGDYAPDPLTVAIGLFFLLPLFFTLVRISTVYDQPLREAFLAFLINRFQDKLTFWIRQKQFWIEAAVFSLLYLYANIEKNKKWLKTTVSSHFSLEEAQGLFVPVGSVNAFAPLNTRFWCGCG